MSTRADSAPKMEARGGGSALPRIGLSGQVIIGLVLGIGAGLFFGEPVAVVQPLGSIFIGLLQMTVIPYIVVSLIAAIGRLSMAQVKLLALKGGGLIPVFWGIILLAVAVILLEPQRRARRLRHRADASVGRRTRPRFPSMPLRIP